MQIKSMILIIIFNSCALKNNSRPSNVKVKEFELTNFASLSNNSLLENVTLINFKIERNSISNCESPILTYKAVVFDHEVLLHQFDHETSSCLSRDFLSIDDRKFVFDSICNSPNDNLFITADLISGNYQFSFNGKNYLAMFVSNLSISDRYTNFIFWLFEFNGKNVSLLLNSSTAFADIRALDDFNNDSQLDFAHWEWGKNKIEMLSRQENGFKSNSSYFIPVEMKKKSDMEVPMINLNTKYLWPKKLNIPRVGGD